jgi:hypothetical protein
MNNMKLIGLAAHNYHDRNKFFPSPRAATAEMSWRVEMLPFVDQGAMFNMLNKNAAWDSPANAAFNTQMPMVFDFPGEKPAGMETSNTKFQYFTGPNTMFPDPQTKIRLTQIADGSSNTFLFAEAATPVPWMKPADMAITPNGPLPLPPGIFLGAMADGTVHIIDRGKVNDNDLRGIIGPNDGKFLPPGMN